MSYADDLKIIKELHDSGHISTQDFNTTVQHVLAVMTNPLVAIDPGHVHNMAGAPTPTPPYLSGAYGGVKANPVRNPESYYHTEDLARMVAMRLRVSEGALHPFQHWHFHKLNEEKVVVMIVNNDQVTMLEDEWPLFPSDALITKLRLLGK